MKVDTKEIKESQALETADLRSLEGPQAEQSLELRLLAILNEADLNEQEFLQRCFPDRYEVVEIDGQLFCELDSGEIVETTLKDLQADLLWGISYTFDESVSHDTAAAYEAAKEAFIQGYYSGIQEILKGIRGPITEHTESFRSLGHRMLAFPQPWGKDMGVLAEQIALSMLVRNQDLEIQVASASPREDVELKVDFFLAWQDEQSGLRRCCGVQFFNAPKRAQLEYKVTQIAEASRQLQDLNIALDGVPVEGIVPLKVNWKFLKQRLNRWHEDDRPPGGVERYLRDSEKEQVFRVVRQREPGVL